jgi:hypothetical protein
MDIKHSDPILSVEEAWLTMTICIMATEEFAVGGRSCGRERCVREIYVSRTGDPVHAGDKALTQETPTQRGRVNRYDIGICCFFARHASFSVISWREQDFNEMMMGSALY